jgi:Spy/CpxP family protein refolding chaperone
MKKTWQQWAVGILIVGSFASGGIAQEAPLPPAATHSHTAGASARGRSSGFGFAALLERTISLTPEQSDAVRGLLAEQRRQNQTLREQTDSKIRALLNPEQQKKFDAFLAEQKTRRAGRHSNAA